MSSGEMKLSLKYVIIKTRRCVYFFVMGTAVTKSNVPSYWTEMSLKLKCPGYSTI